MKNIAFLMISLKTGGGNRVFIELANQLVGKYKVDLIYPANHNQKNTFEIDSRINFIPVGKIYKFKPLFVFNILKTIFFIALKKRNSIVIFSDPILGFPSIIFKRKYAYRFLQSDDYAIYDDLFLLKNRVFLGIYKFLTKISYRFKFNFIFNSKFVFNTFQNISGRHDVKPQIVNPAINPVIFTNHALRSSERLVMATMARTHPLKGFQEFIKAYENLDPSVKNKIKKIYVISSDNLSQFNTSDFTLIKPSSDGQIAEILNETDIFISTSWREGFGLPPLEAMACASAVILSDSGGVNEYAEPGTNCLMFEPKNVTALSEHLNNLISNSALRETLSTSGIKTATNFTWQNSAKQLEAIIERS